MQEKTTVGVYLSEVMKIDENRGRKWTRELREKIMRSAK